MSIPHSLKDKYLYYYPYLFLAYLFCLFSFGRSFVIINIPTFPVPVFITEIFLAVSLPYIVFNAEKILEINRFFLFPLLLFSGLGLFYLAAGLIQENLFTLRDIVLCIYPLFFVILSFVIFQLERHKKVYLYLILISNLFVLITGRLFLWSQEVLGSNLLLPEFLMRFLDQQRSFHFGFYYGVSICFLLSIILVGKKRSLRSVSSFLMALNIYILVISVCRSAWLAGGVVFLFYLLSYPKAIRASLLLLILVMGFISLFIILDYDFHASKGRVIVKGKLLSFQKIINSDTDIRQNQTKEKKNSMSTDNRFKSTPGKQVVSSAIAPQKQNITPPLEKQILASTFTTKWRLSIWKQAIDFARESMWLGKGFGVYPDYYFPTDPNHLMQNIKKIDVGSGIIPAHNELITIFYKMGLIGLGIFLFFNIYVFIMGHRALQITKQSFSAIVNLTTLGCFCWWHIMALTSDMIDSPNMNIFLWVFLGILLNLMNTKNKEGSFG